MRPRTVIAALLVLFGTAVCWRLGFWQLSRLGEKRAANAALRHAMEAPPVVVEGALPPLSSAVQRRVQLSGSFDESIHILLSGRAQGGSPGVHVVTPYRTDRGQMVLVDRGWLFSADARRARPQDHPEPVHRTVLGVAHAIAIGQRDLPWRRLPTDAESVTLWSARSLDLDSLVARLPYPVVSYAIAELPGAGVPLVPARAAPRPLDEFMHVSYAIQWFLFGSILLFGSALVAWSRRRSAVSLAPPAPDFPVR